MRAEGANIRTAGDGNEALAQCEDGAVDAVILDMMLPRRSGFLVLEKLTALDDPPYVVMVTANQGKRHMEYAETLGVDAYLVKPVPLQRLVDTVERLIEQEDE
jgi:DNA-binding response OmpR family regulator